MEASREAPVAPDVDACCICLSNVSDPAVLDGCSHHFCATCIQAWSARENRCPLCKRRFTSITTAARTHAVAHLDQRYVWDGVVTEDDLEDVVDSIVCNICQSGALLGRSC
jgi:hypothetical protein